MPYWGNRGCAQHWCRCRRQRFCICHHCCRPAVSLRRTLVQAGPAKYQSQSHACGRHSCHNLVSSSVQRLTTNTLCVNCSAAAAAAAVCFQLLYLPCDVLVPAAIGGVIDENNAAKLQCKFVAEAANGPTTPEVMMWDMTLAAAD